MRAIILGDGNMGRACAGALAEHGIDAEVVGRPPGASGHDPARFRGADVVFDFSLGEAVAGNVEAALAGGARAFVIGTTGWDADRGRVQRTLAVHLASAVAAANLSIGVALFARVVEHATRLFGAFGDLYDPFLVEWHRRTKHDRPSGTAKELSRRILAAHPRKQRLADPGAEGAPAPEELDVAVVRAGASPGMHLVGFDAPGETLELRLTARDRSAYAAGAVAAAEWLLAAPRSPGLHAFDEVVDALASAVAPAGPAAQAAPAGPAAPGTAPTTGTAPPPLARSSSTADPRSSLKGAPR